MNMTLVSPSATPRNPHPISPAAPVPKVRLYVDRPQGDNWFVHVGYIKDRGRWRTEPHAHPAYGQVIFVRTGRGTINLEGRGVPFEGPCALLLPPDCVHGLDYEIDVERWVVTIELGYLAKINTRLHEFIALWRTPRMIPLPDHDEAAAGLYRSISALKQEAESDAMGHWIGAEARLTNLQLMLVRQTRLEEDLVENAKGSDVRKAERFRKLIDEHFRENLSLKDYVSKMGMSLTQLRAVCAAVSEQSPRKMIHARIMTEAKRDLIFGDMSVSQIAFRLGFADAAYFTHFFRRETGQAPSEFRLASRRQTSSDLLVT
ncbi:AraC family transcriptional activator of pobA [Paraburkholderia sp. GAS333]|uniref:helix-turn-helix domain-containing protein n=1 Tax=Paraburkholderia sp. GAS333 TaxID=3156279 RepID=UPI003D245ACE